MNVRLAAQALSSGVADALEFLRNSQHENFLQCSATIEFVRKLDKIFDILNSRNPFGKGFKSPIRPQTLQYFREIFTETTNYFKTLKVENVPLICHGRKTFAVGFILTMESTLALANDLFHLENNPFDYLMTYKCSQDHIELFFSCLRSRGGRNNNPNTQQLKWSLRQLLLKNSIRASSSANCIDFDSLCSLVLNFRSEERTQNQNVGENANEPSLDILNSHMINLTNVNLNYYQENIVYYISGYIVRQFLKNMNCTACADILLFRKEKFGDHDYCISPNLNARFSCIVNRGGLLQASNIVCDIVTFLEKSFRAAQGQNRIIKIKQILINSAVNHFGTKLDLFIPKHPIAEEIICEDLHELQLIKNIGSIF